MNLASLDLLTFVGFVALVVVVSLVASRRETGADDYFLAGRSLTWPLIGLSLIASNISTEHFVGMSGAGFGSSGLAIASYEWIAALTLLAVAFFLLPRYLAAGITTMPEFFERRFGPVPRTIFAAYMLVAYVVVGMASVLYAGALGMQTVFDLDLTTGIWAIGLLAGGYTVYGGLKAVVWTDVLQGAALILGGLLVAFLALDAAGGPAAFLDANADKLHMALPADDPDLPWTALLLGIWIPNFFYWGCNQFITQRALGSKSLRHGQLGIVLAAWLKLAIPLIVVVPGIVAHQLYADRVARGDQAYAVLVHELLPAGLRGVFFAALFGAVMSTLDSMLNSASTIFTVDVWSRWLRPRDDSRALMRVGRWTTAALVVLACLAAPLPARFEGVFRYIQLFWGFVSPGVVVAFAFGFFVPRAGAFAATVALVVSPVVYGALLMLFPETAFLNHMAVAALVVSGLLAVVVALRPAPPAPLRARGTGPLVDTRPSRLAAALGLGAAVATIALYVRFW